MGISSTGSPFYLTELFMNPLNLISSLSGGFGIATRGLTGMLRVAAEPFSSYRDTGAPSLGKPSVDELISRLDPETQANMAAQRAVQREMQQITLATNLLQSEHEGRMAVIRNTKAS
jgi:hypothetical protein